MPQQVVAGATLQCSFGTAPSSLLVTPENLVFAGKRPAASIMDNVIGKNIAPFGMCTTVSNPQVASATTAAQGVLTPQPCMPVIVAPWAPGATTVMVRKKPALHNSCKLMCNWGGVISVVNPGQTNVNAK